jgi:glycosyltransferase involved in cell wall biosynthesis
VLFCPQDYMESFDEFVPLFDDRMTFAVTRQSGYREWRPIMVTLSPFRELKPREASRVAAPLSPAVLVSRRKLMMLELPNTLVFGAAWLALFWRAGAACWRSYSVGGTRPAEQQLDFWLEEMLFVKQLYQNPDLQRLASETPLLSRGNIAVRPDLTKPYRVLPRVLVVAPYLPFPLSHGGAVRIYNLCKALADKVDFLLICFREVVDEVDYEELHKIFRRVYVVDRDEIHNQPDLPKQVNHFETSSMRALIAGVAKEQAIDLMQIEYTDMAAYREAAPQRPAILVEHDITYTLHRQFTERDKSEAVAQEYQRWLKFESERLAAFDSVFVMSEQDQVEAVKSGANRLRSFVIPNGVDLQRFRALDPPQGETEIFYVGSFRHLPNYLGFEELRNTIMPRVWEKFPHAKLRVVAGPDHEKHWLSALKGATIPHLDPRIIIHGFVSDLAPLYENAHIVAVPLPLSAGTNIKVMEALACQRAVVTTPVGAQGLGLKNEFDALICGLGQEFAGALCRLIEDAPLRDAIARQGRLSAEGRFGWDAIARDALDAYSLLIRESRAKRPTGNGRQREQQKKTDQHENDHRSEGRGILESA